MDASRFVGLFFLTLSFVLQSQQKASDDITRLICPLIDHPSTVGDLVVHNIVQTESCLNGRNTIGCCIPRFYCDFNTSHTDLSLYGPPGYRMTCTDVYFCCPLNYMLPIPLPKKTRNGSYEDSDSSSDSDSSDSNED